MNRIITLTLVLLTIGKMASAQQCQNDSTGLTPITDLGVGVFNGMQGGLYGNGQNSMPQNHLNAGIQIASQVLPLNAQGNYSINGKIGFISMGMSNANMFFAGLRDSANSYPYLNDKLTMVNGATGGYDIDAILDTTSQYWNTLNQKLSFAGLSNNQVQVIWFMQAKHISGIPENEGIAHIEILESKFLQAFLYFKQRFPNLKQIYCSGRDYGGYSNPGSGTQAVRNRKQYFKEKMVEKLAEKYSEILNVASGPARDLLELYTENPGIEIDTTCIEVDESAIEYAKILNSKFLDKIVFVKSDIFKFQTERKFDLIWSAGLFDYFNDRAFVLLVQKFRKWLKDDGEIIIGNFNEKHNPSRSYMEMFGEWSLNHRSEEDLYRLAAIAGFREEKVHVGRESENVNLFLHLRT